MESAIPQHLRCPRTRTSRVDEGYQPPYPSYVARHASGVTQVVMAYFGLQHPAAEPGAAAHQALRELDAALAAPDGPGHWDRARGVDMAGFGTTLTAAYWDQPTRFERWFAAHGASWTRRSIAGLGRFTELLRPCVQRYETLFSCDTRPEGVAVLAQRMSGAVREHAYWGGARERIPLSQTEALSPSGLASLHTDGALRRVQGHQHLCLIRSGQDWGDTEGEERRLYLQEVEPLLREGMDFLRDHGASVGCHANRYLRVLDAQGRDSDKSYGMSWWRGLDALERWAESHPTHLAIFGAAMNYLSTLGPSAQLKLYHEVTVAAAHEQFFEYLDCHPCTGLLNAC